MGLLQTDIAPIQKPSAITPPGHCKQVKFFSVGRTDTTTSIKAMLPAQVSILEVKQYAGVASDAETTGTVALSFAYVNGTVIGTGTADVVANGATTNDVEMTGLPNLEPRPLLGDINISATYAETGDPSTVGGPWIFSVTYI